jgi:hypothetical protein
MINPKTFNERCDLLDLIQPATGRELARVENANTWLRGDVGQSTRLGGPR